MSEQRAIETKGFKSLGSKSNVYEGLETFPVPPRCKSVTLTSDEVTAICPITSQPDWYTIQVVYTPLMLCIESKTFKLFMHSLREKGMFCEALASYILDEVAVAIAPIRCEVTVIQKPRGGVSIKSVSSTL